MRYRLLLVPLVLLIATLVATLYAVGHALKTTEAEIREQIRAIERTITGPPTFRLTLPVLEQIKNLTGAEIALLDQGQYLVTKPDLVNLQSQIGRTHPQKLHDYELTNTGPDGYQGFVIELPHYHPNAGSTIYVFYPNAKRNSQIENAVRPVLWLGLGGGLLATLLSGYVALRYARAEQRRVLGQVSDGLAHQLRNAATGAKLALQVAVTGDAIDRESLGVAERQLERVEHILKQFLNQQQELNLKRTATDLREVIDAVVTLETPRARHAGTQLLWQRPDFEVRQAVDVDQWSHLVANLLGNAIDAAGVGGSVTLALTATHFTVTDTGPGPSPEVAAKLFEPFVTGKPGGIGLGLMVAKQVADAHGHRLEWRRDNKTTLFQVTFSKH